MGEVVNLNQFRKKRERDGKSRQAAENRARSGQSRGERALRKKDAQSEESSAEGKRLENLEPDEPTAS